MNVVALLIFFLPPQLKRLMKFSMGWRICWGLTHSQKRFGHHGKAVLVGMARSRSEPFVPTLADELTAVKETHF